MRRGMSGYSPISISEILKFGLVEGPDCGVPGAPEGFESASVPLSDSPHSRSRVMSQRSVAGPKLEMQNDQCKMQNPAMTLADRVALF